MNFLATLIAKVFREWLGFAQEQSERPPTLKDANTPKEIRDAADAAVHDWLRSKNDDRN